MTTEEETYIVCKAAPVDGRETPSATIKIVRDLDEALGLVEDSQCPSMGDGLLKLDAEMIHRALMQLPQGTFDRLLVRMLQEEADARRLAISSIMRPAGHPKEPGDAL